MTLYERLGGEAAIAAVVENFYELMLDDERVSIFTKLPNLVLVPNNYEGTDMKTVHYSLSLPWKIRSNIQIIS